MIRLTMRPRHHRRWIAAVFSAGLAGCATVDPDYERPPIEAAATDWIDRESVPVAEAEFIAWWRNLGDPVLTRLVEASLQDNLTIRQALLRVEEARDRKSVV